MRGGKRVAVIGGGFLGSELAVALAHKGKSVGLEVTQVYPEYGNMAKVVPEYLSKWTTKRVQEEGVATVSGSRVKAVSETKVQPVRFLAYPFFCGGFLGKPSLERGG